MESLSPFLWGSCIPYNMPVYPGARRITPKPVSVLRLRLDPRPLRSCPETGLWVSAAIKASLCQKTAKVILHDILAKNGSRREVVNPSQVNSAAFQNCPRSGGCAFRLPLAPCHAFPFQRWNFKTTHPDRWSDFRTCSSPRNAARNARIVLKWPEAKLRGQRGARCLLLACNHRASLGAVRVLLWLSRSCDVGHPRTRGQLLRLVADAPSCPPLCPYGKLR
jgi:hypothetical protein